MTQKVLLNSKEVDIILHRLACQLIEKHLDFKDTILIGIQPRGTFLAERLKEVLEKEYQTPEIQLGYLDITFLEMISEEPKSLLKPTKQILIL